MKGFLLGFLLGILLLLGVIWHYSRKHDHVALVRRDIKSAASDLREYVAEKIGTNNLTGDEIREELIKTGKVVRRKAEELGASIADATADPRRTAVIKAKLLADQSLASLNISVSCNNGEVTLAGTATSTENIRKAIKTTLEVEGVKRVISTIRVK